MKRREIGSGLDWHLQRAAELSAILTSDGVPADYRIATDNRDVIDIAVDVASKPQWRRQETAILFTLSFCVEQRLMHDDIDFPTFPLSKMAIDLCREACLQQAQ